MLGRKKKEEPNDLYHQMFNKLCGKISTVADAYLEIINSEENLEEKVAYMKVLETQCDMEVHKIYKVLRESGTSPWDKKDIYTIAKEMDDIVDSMEETSSRLIVFGITKIKAEAKIMAEMTVQAVAELSNLFKYLPNVDDREGLREIIIEINRIENEGDIVYRRALSSLFQEEKDPIEIIKWMRLFEEMEESLDACERVANLLQSVVMKHVSS